jgi:hypothetical protein
MRRPGEWEISFFFSLRLCFSLYVQASAVEREYALGGVCTAPSPHWHPQPQAPSPLLHTWRPHSARPAGTPTCPPAGTCQIPSRRVTVLWRPRWVRAVRWPCVPPLKALVGHTRARVISLYFCFFKVTMQCMHSKIILKEGRVARPSLRCVCSHFLRFSESMVGGSAAVLPVQPTPVSLTRCLSLSTLRLSVAALPT